MSETILKGSVNQTTYVFIQDNSVTTGEGLTGLAFNSAGLTCYYVRPLAAAVAITLATQTVTGAHTDGGFVEIDAVNMKGIYRLDLPDAVVASGVDNVTLHLRGAINMAPTAHKIQLTAFDLQTSSVAQTGDSYDRIGAAGAGLSNINLPDQTMNITGNLSGSVGSVTTVSDKTGYSLIQAFPTNFADMAITLTTGQVTAGNMRGTDDALLAASYTAPDNTGIAANGVAIAAVPTLVEMTAAFTQIKGATWSATDTLEAIRDRGDAAWITATTTISSNMRGTDGALTDKAGFALSATGADLIPYNSTFLTASAKANWSDTLVTYTDGMAGKRVKGITAVPALDATVNDAAATTTSFISTLTGYGDTFFNDALMVVEIATDKWQARPVASYTSATGAFTFDEEFISAPPNGVAISVLITHIHTVSEMKAGLATSAAQTTAQNDLDIITGATGVNLLTATQASIDAIETDTNELQLNQGAWTTATGFATEVKQDIIDTNVDAILVDSGTTIPTQISALNNISAADVNTQVDNVINVAATTEPASAPTSTSPVGQKIGYLFAGVKNKTLQTASSRIIRNDGDTANISSEAISDDGTTFTKGKGI